jgi:hypothetical protein
MIHPVLTIMWQAAAAAAPVEAAAAAAPRPPVQPLLTPPPPRPLPSRPLTCPTAPSGSCSVYAQYGPSTGMVLPWILSAQLHNEPHSTSLTTGRLLSGRYTATVVTAGKSHVQPHVESACSLHHPIIVDQTTDSCMWVSASQPWCWCVQTLSITPPPHPTPVTLPLQRRAQCGAYSAPLPCVIA